MIVDMTAQEMELVLHALKEYGKHKQGEGLSRDQVDNLAARLEVVAWEHRFDPPSVQASR